MTEPTDDRLDALLDDALSVEPLNTGAVRARILARIDTPVDPWNRLLNWLAGGPRLVRPAALAMVPLVLGFALGVGLPELGALEREPMDAADLLAFVSIEDFADE